MTLVYYNILLCYLNLFLMYIYYFKINIKLSNEYNWINRHQNPMGNEAIQCETQSHSTDPEQ